MSQHAKNLKLAELMEWVLIEHGGFFFIKDAPFEGMELEPYTADNMEGLSQFAAVLLKFPQVMERLVATDSHTDKGLVSDERYIGYGGDYQGYLTSDRVPTQENILDEILRMHGVDV